MIIGHFTSCSAGGTCLIKVISNRLIGQGTKTGHKNMECGTKSGDREQELTLRSHILTSPPRQPEARISLEDGWKAIHQGVRGCPVRMCVHRPLLMSVTLTVWSPWVEAIFVLHEKQKRKRVVSEWFCNQEGLVICCSLNHSQFSYTIMLK